MTSTEICSCGAEVRVYEGINSDGHKFVSGQCPVCDRWTYKDISEPVCNDIRVKVDGHIIAFEMYGKHIFKVFGLDQIAEMDEYQKGLHAQRIRYTVQPHITEDSPSYTVGDLMDRRVVYVFPDKEVRP